MYVCTLLFISAEQCQAQVVGGLDLVFVLDASGSIGSIDFEKMKDSVINIVSSLTIGPENTRLAIIVFETEVNLIFNLNAHTNNISLIEAIGNITFTSGGTNTHLALRLLRESTVSELLGVRPGSQSTKVAIVITDGRSNSPTLTKEEADKVRMETDFLVFAVGVGGGVGLTELTNIAGSSDFVIQLGGFTPTELQNLETDIQMETCRSTYIYVRMYEYMYLHMYIMGNMCTHVRNYIC